MSAAGGRKVLVRVPATSANLGPGFDALGIALSLDNRFEAEESDALELSGCEDAYRGEDNLFVRAYKRALAELGESFRGLRVRFASEVPVARGLGSSSTCIVGGLLAADSLHGGRLGRARLLDLAAELEGHPDNVAPALLGGFVSAVLDGGKVVASRFAVDESLKFHALVPPFELATSKARAALPKELPFKDAVFNVGRAALVVAAFASRDYAALAIACKDRLHEVYRSPLIPGFDEIIRAVKGAGATAAFLSGAGPTILAICESDDARFSAEIEPILAARPEGRWRHLVLSPDNKGAEATIELSS